MSEKVKIWEANVWVGINEDKSITFFGESINDLRDSIANWIIENQPEKFGNASPSYEITRRYNYSHASSTNPVRIQDKEITDGWVGVDGAEVDWSVYHHFDDVKSVAIHFVNQSMVPYKGSDWKEIKVEAGTFPLHKVRIVKRIENELELNDYLQRGWYLLSLESSGKTSYDGQLIERKVLFVVGHPEEDADHLPAPTSSTRRRALY